MILNTNAPIISLKKISDADFGIAKVTKPILVYLKILLDI